MKNFIKVVVFSVLVISSYALFANEYIPPINPSPPPVEEVLDLGAMTMEQFIALGDKVYNGKGTCTLCHNPVVKRAPLLEAVASVAAERLKDPRYKGSAANSGEYIMESMVKPSAYVVTGFGVTGTNDTKSPMPDVSTGAIGLSEAEIKAVTAYLQNLAGVDVTVEIPKGGVQEEKKGESTAAPAKTAGDAVKKYGCGACHKIAGEQGAIGPDLTKIGTMKKRDYLARALLDPDADIAEGFPPGMMPKDYADKLTAGEFELIIDFMVKS